MYKNDANSANLPQVELISKSIILHSSNKNSYIASQDVFSSSKANDEKGKCSHDYVPVVFSFVENKGFPCPKCIIFRKDLAKSSLKTSIP